MLTWAEAHRLAISLSTRVLTRNPCDISELIAVPEIAEAAGIVVRYAPLPSLAGVYVAGKGDAPPGIMVNTRLPWAKQRYTLAHEVGHHYFQHGSQADVDTDWLVAGAGGSSTSDFEKLAEAFAAWLLMPRRHVDAAIGRLGHHGHFSPSDVYRLSLLLGASYRATCVHLSTLGRLKWTAVDGLLKVQPKATKKELIGTRPVAVSTGDVHIVRPALNRRHDVRSGDVLLFDCGAPLGEFPDLVLSSPGRQHGDRSCLVVLPSEVANPVRPSTRLTLDTTEGPIAVVVHHELSGVSEAWFR
jgi:Zn-dependent peptidase ImmA (M78 family)